MIQVSNLNTWSSLDVSLVLDFKLSSHLPETETNALCSAVPPLVTIRSVYKPSSSLKRLGRVKVVTPLPVSIFTHLESNRRVSGNGTGS